VERAIVQSAGAPEKKSSGQPRLEKKQFRVNLLNLYPGLRRFLRSPRPDRINYGFTLTAFAIVVALLFVGPQRRAENVALNLFWALVALILLGFPL